MRDLPSLHFDCLVVMGLKLLSSTLIYVEEHGLKIYSHDIDVQIMRFCIRIQGRLGWVGYPTYGFKNMKEYMDCVCAKASITLFALDKSKSFQPRTLHGVTL